MTLVNLPGDSLLGGVPILTPSNLNNYINQGYTIPAFTTGNTYSKLCTLNFSGNDAVTTIRFLLINTENWVDYNTQYAEVILKAGIRGDVSSGVKKCHINCVTSKVINPVNIIAVETQNDANGYSVEVYFNQVNGAGGGRKYFLLPTLIKSTIPKVTKVQFYNNLPSIASLPTGTQIVCDGGSRDLVVIQVFYNGSWLVQDMGGTNLPFVVNTENAQYLYGTPNWSTDGLVFPNTSIIMDTSTILLSLTTGYINGTTLAYEPVFHQGTDKKIRFINRSTGALVTTPDNNMSFVLAFSRLR